MNETLAYRIRQIIGDDPKISEIKMFGGLCFMLNGNMLVCTMKSGDLLVRTGEKRVDEALARPGAKRMHMGAREMKGYVVVDGETVSENSLKEWVALATEFVGPLRVKVKTTKQRPND